VQAVAQQIPCSQNPDKQSVVAMHVPPGGFFPQLVLTQKFPVVQSMLTAQLLLQVPVVPHWNGSHGRVAPRTHVPVPLQSEASVSVDPVHEPAAHEVPLG
jgi:hypothetical protein